MSNIARCEHIDFTVWCLHRHCNDQRRHEQAHEAIEGPADDAATAELLRIGSVRYEEHTARSRSRRTRVLSRAAARELVYARAYAIIIRVAVSDVIADERW